LKEKSAAITPGQVEHIAHLARIELRESDTEKFTDQLGGILDYVNTLKEIDTTGIDPTFLMIPRSNVFRDDVVKPSLSQEESLSNAPAKEEGCFKTPRILNAQDVS
jgi:aspartyl-tRNA(Asn)/glutamyl-tRNA(Gln) amidotransferase subunit C